MKLVIILLCCLFSDYLFSQPVKINWQNCYGGSDIDIPHDLKMVDTSIFLFGETYSHNGLIHGNSGNGDLVLFWLDTLGNFKKSKTFGGWECEYAAKVLDPHNGYLYLTGTTCSFNTYPDNHGDSDFFIIKIDTAGNQIWEKCFGGSSRDILYTGILYDSFIYLGGMTLSTDGDITFNNGYWDMWILKVDLNGNVIWQKSIGGSETDILHNISNIESSLMISGNTGSNDSDFTCNPNIYEVQAVVIKSDTSGNLVWKRCFGGWGAEAIKKVFATSDSGYICLGSTESSDGIFNQVRCMGNENR